MTQAVERQTEVVFNDKLTSGDIRFDLEAGQPNFQMVDTYEIPAAGGLGGLLARRDHQPMQISLFEPVYERQLDSELERNFARYLDEQKALQWWHRVAVRQRGDYYLRGWKQDRIWPDFVAMGGETEGKPHVLVFETKGEHTARQPGHRIQAPGAGHPAKRLQLRNDDRAGRPGQRHLPSGVQQSGIPGGGGKPARRL